MHPLVKTTRPESIIIGDFVEFFSRRTPGRSLEICINEKLGKVFKVNTMHLAWSERSQDWQDIIDFMVGHTYFKNQKLQDLAYIRDLSVDSRRVHLGLDTHQAKFKLYISWSMEQEEVNENIFLGLVSRFWYIQGDFHQVFPQGVNAFCVEFFYDWKIELKFYPWSSQNFKLAGRDLPTHSIHNRDKFIVELDDHKLAHKNGLDVNARSFLKLRSFKVLSNFMIEHRLCGRPYVSAFAIEKEKVETYVILDTPYYIKNPDRFSSAGPTL